MTARKPRRRKPADRILEQAVAELFPREESRVADGDVDAFLTGVAAALEAVR